MRLWEQRQLEHLKQTQAQVKDDPQQTEKRKWKRLNIAEQDVIRNGLRCKFVEIRRQPASLFEVRLLA